MLCITLPRRRGSRPDGAREIGGQFIDAANMIINKIQLEIN